MAVAWKFSLSLCLALAASPAGAMQLIVSDFKGGGFSAGQAVDGATPLKLAAGERVTLISSDGRTIKLKGPYEGTPAPGTAEQGANVLDALKNLTAQRAAGSGKAGVVRSGEEDAELPEPWIVDVSRAGQRCVAERHAPVLWRHDANAQSALEIWPADRSWQARATWPASSNRLALPPSLPFRDRQGYLVTVDGQTATITVHVVPDSLPNDAVRVAWMLEKGCIQQAAAMVRLLDR